MSWKFKNHGKKKRQFECFKKPGAQEEPLRACGPSSPCSLKWNGLGQAAEMRNYCILPLTRPCAPTLISSLPLLAGSSSVPDCYGIHTRLLTNTDFQKEKGTATGEGIVHGQIFICFKPLDSFSLYTLCFNFCSFNSVL